MQKGKLLFILGGARSGKSSFAEETAKNFNRDVVYIATFKSDDDPEMQKRLKKHRETRPSSWKTLEIQDADNIILDIKKNKIKNSVIIIECLTILTSNLMIGKEDIEDDEKIIIKIRELIDFIKKDKNNSGNVYILISNEVGQGIVPENELARRYRDVLGHVNRLTAKNSDEFYVMFAGVAVDVKKLANLRRE
jgi:adenosylcobinamide kinase/adenosylcobinamide-phosphate guanylyltransferase